MSPLQVIGAGFGRTGTDSLRIALEILGYRTHHMFSFYEDDQLDPTAFLHAYENDRNGDWDTIYSGFDAAVDWPTCTFYTELVKKYKDAKVILTVRSPESWYKSIINTLAARATNPENKTQLKIDMMKKKVVLQGILSDKEKLKNTEAIQQLFIQHNERVKSTIPPSRLLVMELGEGWERLCKFLDKQIPDVTYPKTNSTQEFQAFYNKM